MSTHATFIRYWSLEIKPNHFHMIKIALLTVFVSLSSVCAFSQQKLLSADNIADSVQAMRNQARPLWRNPDASKSQLDQSINILTSALNYLNNPAFKASTQGNFYLKFRKGDTYLDLLTAYVRNRQYAEATQVLNQLYDINSPWYTLIAKDSVFTEFRKIPQVVSLIDQFKLRASMWQGKAISSKYQVDLSEDEKIAGLSSLWMNAKYNFVYLDKLTTDWNKTYLAFLPQVRATTSTADYYKVLQRFYASLNDGHTNVFFPAELRKQFNSRPPIRTELIEGRVLITAVSNDSLLEAGIVPGLEIMSINDIDVHTYAKNNIEPYQSASTPQDLEIRKYSYGLLNGAEKEPVKLHLRNSKNKQWSQLVNRSGYTNNKVQKSVSFKVIDGYGYLQLNDFDDESIVKQFDSLYQEIAKTKGLVIDIRYNGGGDSWIGYHILSTLTSKGTSTSTSRIPSYNPRFGKEWYFDNPGSIEPDQKRLYQMPVVLLIGARTYSAAEDFAVAFDCMQRGELIGQPTGGSTGQPLSFNLPGGGWARVCSKEDTYPDGKKFVGVGVQPNVLVKTTISDVLKGRDATLEKALEILRKR